VICKADISSRSAALDYVKQGIRINALNLDPIVTGLMVRSADQVGITFDDIGAMVPIGRIGQAAKIAQTVVVLCSNAVSYITGQLLIVDGGFTVARQASSWRCQGSKSFQTELHIHLQPELIRQVAQASEINTERLDLVYRFAKQDLQLQHIAMLLLAELCSDGMMGQLYVESLTQALAIYLLRHYSEVTSIITSENRSLTYSQLQQAIDYIHAHLNRDLSLAELAASSTLAPLTSPICSNRQ
jgi:hypothetical protein